MDSLFTSFSGGPAERFMVAKAKTELICQSISWKIYRLLPLPDLYCLSRQESEEAVEILCQLYWLRDAFGQTLRWLCAYLEVHRLYIPLTDSSTLTPEKLLAVLDGLRELYDETALSYLEFMQAVYKRQVA